LFFQKLVEYLDKKVHFRFAKFAIHFVPIPTPFFYLQKMNIAGITKELFFSQNQRAVFSWAG